MIRNRRSLLVAASLLAALAIVASTLVPGSADDEQQAAAAPAEPRPNIVYIMLDDMSADLMPYATEIAGLQADGMTLENFVYPNSLCCPSRATILSGELPHNTGVLTNTSRHGDGGFGAFIPHQPTSLSVRMHQAGYRTGLMGKYLNEYRPQGPRDWFDYDYPADHVPPGWDEWHVAGGGGYNQMQYEMTTGIDGEVKREYSADFDNPYFTDVLSERAVGFLDRAVTEHGSQPFFLNVWPFAPHPKVRGGFVPAPRDRPDPETGFTGDCGPVDCTEVRAPRTPAFNADTSGKPAWVRRQPLTEEEIAGIDEKFRGRVQMMQSVNDMIGAIRSRLVELGVADNTYIVFGSDNGFHLGQHRLINDGGKSTAYEFDSVVPLIVVGPGVEPGSRNAALVQTIDLFPTFETIAGLEPQGRDGASLLGMLHGAPERSWLRDAAFIEFIFHENTSAIDPDAAQPQRLNRQPWTYKAIRTRTETYVEYENGVTEYYDLVTDPYQLDNAADRLAEERKHTLHRTLQRLAGCGAPEGINCWAASQIR